MNDGEAGARETKRTGEASANATSLDTQATLAAAIAPIVSELERDYLRAVLSECRGVVQAAAARAGLSRRTLQRKMRAHGLRKEEFRSS